MFNRRIYYTELIIIISKGDIVITHLHISRCIKIIIIIQMYAVINQRAELYWVVSFLQHGI